MKTIRFESLYSAHYYFDLDTKENSFTDQLHSFITNNFKSYVQEIDAVANDNDIVISDFAKQHDFDKWYGDECVRYFENSASDEDFHKFNDLWDKFSKAEKASGKLEQLERLLSDALSLASEIEELTEASTDEE